MSAPASSPASGLVRSSSASDWVRHLPPAPPPGSSQSAFLRWAAGMGWSRHFPGTPPADMAPPDRAALRRIALEAASGSLPPGAIAVQVDRMKAIDDAAEDRRRAFLSLLERKLSLRADGMRKDAARAGNIMGDTPNRPIDRRRIILPTQGARIEARNGSHGDAAASIFATDRQSGLGQITKELRNLARQGLLRPALERAAAHEKYAPLMTDAPVPDSMLPDVEVDLIRLARGLHEAWGTGAAAAPPARVIPMRKLAEDSRLHEAILLCLRDTGAGRSPKDAASREQEAQLPSHDQSSDDTSAQPHSRGLAQHLGRMDDEDASLIAKFDRLVNAIGLDLPAEDNDSWTGCLEIGNLSYRHRIDWDLVIRRVMFLNREIFLPIGECLCEVVYDLFDVIERRHGREGIVGLPLAGLDDHLLSADWDHWIAIDEIGVTRNDEGTAPGL